jgi:DNA-binding NarL/FixJ family response regulator
VGRGGRAPRLPAPLAEWLQAAARGGDWVGQALKAELTPVNDLFLLALRPRAGGDLLSARERAVAQLYAGGATYREIAERLSLAPATVRAHLRNVFGKLGAHNKAEVAEKLRG